VRESTERHSPERIRTNEERVIDAMHRYAYSLVQDYARPDDRLLEVGFGEGYGSEIVRPWIGEYVGLEVDARAVSHASGRYANPGSTFLVYDGETIPFRDGEFDLVISFQVLEHVDDPDRFLAEARRVTRPGREVLVVTPNRNHRLSDGERPWNRYHVREFNPAELEASLRGVFDSVEIFGLLGSEPMNAIERARVDRARRLARLDPLGLRYRLPESVDTRLRASFRRRSGAGGTTPADVGVEHMRHSRDEVDSSLNLLGVGRAEDVLARRT
jgi:SAM-dependent methyltransferase